ncbi:MAG TPA: DUF1349 domain-containing protein, partial [Chitinophagaceae bacterium]|nr:DUF1349 domain-containing protein [Chitinophagaceae bacterium]
CGNSSGMYYRNQSMTDWVNYSGVLPTIAAITDFMCFNDGGTDARLYASYFGRGVWETKLESFHTCTTPVMNTPVWNSGWVQLSWNNTGAASYTIQYRPVGELGWQNISCTGTSYSLSGLQGCSRYEFRVQANCGSDLSLWSGKTEVETSSDPLSSDFDAHQDIGPVGSPGSVCYDALHQRYTILASGEDIWDKNDEFHFLYKQMSGDISISARVKHVGNIYGWAKAGVMIRESLNTDSKQSMCVLTPGNGFAHQWRENTNDWSSNTDTAGAEPGWVKMERIGNSFTAYFSSDGLNWNLLNTVTISMANTVYVGLANCSHIDSTLNDAVFDHIVINDIALNAPAEPLPVAAPFQVYPNPVASELRISFTDESLIRATMYLTIRDMQGKELARQEKKAGASVSVIPVSSLATGIYTLELNGAQHYVTRIEKR